MEKKTWLGIGSWTYPYHCGLGNKINEKLRVYNPMTPYDLILEAKKQGVRCVQICENRPLDIYTNIELKEIRKFAEKKGIQLEIGMRGATKENLKKMIEMTHVLGAGLLRCVIDSENYEPELEEILINLKEIQPILEKYGIVLGVENHDRFKAQQFAYIMEQLDDKHFGIVLDTTNSLSQEEKVEDVLECLAKYTVCLHFKDYDIIRGSGTIGLEIVGTAVGDGRQKTEMILERLCKDAQQDFSTIVEFWMPYEANLEKTLKKEREWAEKSVVYLQELFRKLRL